MLELIIFILILITLSFGIYSYSKLRNTTSATAFLAFIIATLLFGLSRLLLVLADAGVYEIESITVHIFWHIILYFSLVTFLWGGLSLKNESTKLQNKDYLFLITITILTLFIFPIVYYLGPYFDKYFLGSIFDSLGLHHLLAVLFAFIVAVIFYKQIRHWGEAFILSVLPVILFLGFVGFQHVWELISENLKLIELGEETIEFVEQLIIVPSLLFLITGLVMIFNYFKSKK